MLEMECTYENSILEQITLSVRQLIEMALYVCFHYIYSPENAAQLCAIVKEVKSYLCQM